MKEKEKKENKIIQKIKKEQIGKEEKKEWVQRRKSKWSSSFFVYSESESVQSIQTQSYWMPNCNLLLLWPKSINFLIFKWLRENIVAQIIWQKSIIYSPVNDFLVSFG